MITKGLVVGTAAALLFLASQTFSQNDSSSLSLRLEYKIPLGEVAGRIDHMAIDLKRQRLFVAELGNNTVGVIDLDARKVLRVITGQKEPQGVAYAAITDTLYVSNAGDGSVRQFQGEQYAPLGSIDLGNDADNIRIDASTNRIFVGFGNGALAVIAAESRTKLVAIQLKAHPESFQLDPSSGRIFVNVPKAREIAVVNLAEGKQTASWPVGNDSNFPMAIEQSTQRLLVVFRNPPQLGVFSLRDGAQIAQVRTCGDADDLFVDAKRHRIYVSCGEGFLDVLETRDSAYRRVALIPTMVGARTSLFVAEMDRLFLAARAAAGEPAAVWVYRPVP